MCQEGRLLIWRNWNTNWSRNWVSCWKSGSAVVGKDCANDLAPKIINNNSCFVMEMLTKKRSGQGGNTQESVDLPSYLQMEHTPKLLPRNPYNGKRMYWSQGNGVSNQFPIDLRTKHGKVSRINFAECEPTFLRTPSKKLVMGPKSQRHRYTEREARESKGYTKTVYLKTNSKDIISSKWYWEGNQ